jgi:hypothetical protein
MPSNLRKRGAVSSLGGVFDSIQQHRMGVRLDLDHTLDLDQIACGPFG